VRAAWSDATHGDLRPAEDAGRGLARWVGRVTTGDTAHSATDHTVGHHGPVGRVHWLTQVHGAEVVRVEGGGPLHGRPAPTVVAVHAGSGDGLVSEVAGNALAILTADCASLALGSPEGVFGAVHAGWRGLMAGVVEATVATMRAMGAVDVVGALGPCIHAECYEFSEADLALVMDVYGPGVQGRTTTGRPALDIPATVAAALAACGAAQTEGRSACTACGDGYFSHRGRGDTARQALAVWSTDRTSAR
jgi:polyphenol oxidase